MHFVVRVICCMVRVVTTFALIHSDGFALMQVFVGIAGRRGSDVHCHRDGRKAL